MCSSWSWLISTASEGRSDRLSAYMFFIGRICDSVRWEWVCKTEQNENVAMSQKAVHHLLISSGKRLTDLLLFSQLLLRQWRVGRSSGPLPTHHPLQQTDTHSHHLLSDSDTIAGASRSPSDLISLSSPPWLWVEPCISLTSQIKAMDKHSCLTSKREASCSQ